MAAFKICQILLLALPIFLEAKIVRHTFRVAYLTDSPDGVVVKHALGINGKFPGPVINAEVNDTLEITVVNNIQDGQNVTMHWHGILQRGTPFEDGPALITQCPLKVNRSQVYTFQVPDAGTFWYHSHVNSQYTEGLWGVLIVRGKPEVHRAHYQDEITITLNDWYHTSGHENEDYLLSNRSEGAPPYPSSVLMNGMGRYPCRYALLQGRLCTGLLQKRPLSYVQPGKTYRLRLLNTAGWTAFNFTVEGHLLQTIEVDGVDTVVGKPVQAVHIAPGQRYSFLLTVPRRGRIGSRFLMRASARTEFLFRRPHNINPFPDALFQEVTGVLQYSLLSFSSWEMFDYNQKYTVSPWSNTEFLDEMSLTPFDRVVPPAEFNTSLELNTLFTEDGEGVRRGSFNLHPAQLPQGKPILAKMLNNDTIPKSMFPVHIKWGEVVQVVINNPEYGPHPIHLHGHHFWVMGMGKQGDGNYNATIHQLNYGGLRRDTALVKEHSWLVIRFRADNVGVWSLHCHVDWHMLTGMMMNFIEAAELADTVKIPAEARKVCADHNIII